MSMSDRELLELAAKAAGRRLEWGSHPSIWAPMYRIGATQYPWDPINDYGDALILAQTLRLNLKFRGEAVYAMQSWPRIGSSDGAVDRDVRRAIVRAAAEIGRAMG